MKGNTSAVIKDLRNDFVQLANCGEYVLTQEINNNIQGIVSALDSLKLDSSFAANSTAWHRKFDSNLIQKDQSSLIDLMSQGSVLVRELMINLDKKSMANLQESEVRKAHYVVNQKLRAFLKSVHPFSYGAYARLNNYAMTVGLTDRYANIRNELVSKEPPNDIDTFDQWANKTNPNKPGFRTPDWRDFNYGFSHNKINRFENRASSTNKNSAGQFYPDTSRLVASANPSLLPSKSSIQINNEPALPRSESRNLAYSAYPPIQNQDWKKTATEAGIKVGFPGISEQKYRYTPPVKANYLNFVINPALNIGLLGRPFSEVLHEPIGTEYQSRFKSAYETPIDKFPWIKQF